MTQALIVSTARTPLAKSWKGAFNMTHGATLGGHAVKAAVERAGIDPGALLGRALAHEVGHLLLRSPGHSPGGLMRAVWTDEELAAAAAAGEI